MVNQTKFTTDELRHWAFFTHAQDPARVHNRSTENVITAALKPEAIEAESDVDRVVLLFRSDTSFQFDLGWAGTRSAATSGMPMEKLAELVLAGRVQALKKFPAVAYRRDDGAAYVGQDGRRFINLSDCPLDRDLEDPDSRPLGVEVERAAEVAVWPTKGHHIKGRPAESRWGLYRPCDAVRFRLDTMPSTGGSAVIPDAFLDRGGMWEVKSSYAVFEMPRTEAGDTLLKEHGITALISADSVILPVKLSPFDGNGQHQARWAEVPGEHTLRGTGRMYGSSSVTSFDVAAPGRGSWLTMGAVILTADFDGQVYIITTPKKVKK